MTAPQRRLGARAATALERGRALAGSVSRAIGEAPLGDKDLATTLRDVARKTWAFLTEPVETADLGETGRDIERHLRIALVVIAALVIGVGGWAAFTDIAGAIISSGTVVVESSSKSIQHPDGGVVDSIAVREGDRVAAGDLLLSLDATLVRANLAIIEKQLDELAAEEARLVAERDNSDTLVVPALLAGREEAPEVARILVSQRDLLSARRSAQSERRAQLGEQISQLSREIEGLESQATAKATEIDLIDRELVDLEKLLQKRLVVTARVNEMKRNRTRLDGERGSLISDIARARGTISEREIQLVQLDEEYRADVLTKLQEARRQLAQLLEQKVAAEDRLKRIEIRSPQNGIVHELAVHTVGGVVSPGETLMMVVPDADTLVIDGRISPNDIDQVHVGQAARVRFSGLDRRSTPELDAHVINVAADLTEDRKTGARYYQIRLDLPAGEIARLGASKIVPGMPAEVFIATGERSALSYLVKPLTDQMARACETSAFSGKTGTGYPSVNP
ncbi:MAG: HlyD family type I secretion periplasmic adaptor subunit [Hyphomicrobiales bacterium]